MKRLRSAVLLSLASLLVADGYAVPVISTISGTLGTGQSVVISGSGFGTKARSKLLLWSDAQTGTITGHPTLSNSTTLSGEHMTVITDSNKRWGTAAYRSNVNYTSSERAATLRPSPMTVTYGTKILISWWEKSDVGAYIPENWKIGVRWWDGSAGSPHYPSHYFASLASGSTGASNLRFVTEFPTRSTGLGSSYGFPTSTWRRITGLYQMNSSLGSADGTLKIYKNNTQTTSITGWSFNESSTSPSGRAIEAFADVPYYQHVIANGNWPSGTNWWVTDLALDDSWNRVEFCNASTYAASTQCELQPYTSWTANNITISMILGMLSSGWFYVCDENNVCNSAGSSGTGLSGLANPVIVSVSPSNGPHTGGTTVTLFGGDFVATPQVTVNGVDATSETFVDANNVTFVTPAGPPDTAVDIVLTNPDSQSATKVAAFTYDPEAVTIDPVAEAFGWIEP